MLRWRRIRLWLIGWVWAVRAHAREFAVLAICFAQPLKGGLPDSDGGHHGTTVNGPVSYGIEIRIARYTSETWIAQLVDSHSRFY